MKKQTEGMDHMTPEKKQNMLDTPQRKRHDTIRTLQGRSHDTIRTPWGRSHDTIRTPQSRIDISQDKNTALQDKEIEEKSVPENQIADLWWRNLVKNDKKTKKEDLDVPLQNLYENGLDDTVKIHKENLEVELKNGERLSTDKKPSGSVVENPSKDKASEVKNMSTHDKKNMTLDDMEEEVLKKLTIIRHDSGLYFFNGRSYQVISDDDQLLELIRCRVSGNAFASCGLKRFSDLVRYMRADQRLYPPNYEKALRNSRYLVALKNGIYDLKSARLLEHSPEFLVFNELDACYTEKQNAAFFARFLNEMSNGDETIILRVLQVMGYIFSGLNEGKCFFVMGTASDSGKSMLGELISKILGEKMVCHISPQQMSTQFGLGNIEGKSLNLSMDLPKGKINRNTVSLIKQITGGDGIVIEQKYQKSREIHSRMRFLFSSNYPVVIPSEDNDDGFWNRMIIIPFMNSIKNSKKDRNLIDKIYQEKDQIVSLCLCFCNKLIENNYIFFNCPLADSMKNEWRFTECENVWSIDLFMSNEVIITGVETDIILTLDLYEKYQIFCTNNKYNFVSFNEFRRYIDNVYKACKHIRSRQGHENARSCYSGLRWKMYNENDD